MIINLRRHTSLLLAFTSFSLIPMRYSHLIRLNRFLVCMSCLVLGFGLIEYILPDSFWDNTINLPAFWIASPFDPFGTFSISESGRFYSWDLSILSGRPIRRLVSVYTEPTTLAAFLIFATVYFSSMVIYYMAGFILDKNDLISGPWSHIYGYYTAINDFFSGNYLGYGIGMAGNYSSMLEFAEIGAESGFGNMLSQIGFGCGIFLLIVVRILMMLQRQFNLTGDPHYGALVVCLFSWCLIYFYSASSLGFGGNVFFFMFAGMWLNNRVIKETMYAKNTVLNTPTSLSSA